MSILIYFLRYAVHYFLTCTAHTVRWAPGVSQVCWQSWSNCRVWPTRRKWGEHLYWRLIWNVLLEARHAKFPLKSLGLSLDKIDYLNLVDCLYWTVFLHWNSYQYSFHNWVNMHSNGITVHNTRLSYCYQNWSLIIAKWYIVARSSWH